MKFDNSGTVEGKMTNAFCGPIYLKMWTHIYAFIKKSGLFKLNSEFGNLTIHGERNILHLSVRKYKKK